MSVLEVPDQTAEGGSTRRVPLGRRVVATLEAARSTLNRDRILDDDLLLDDRSRPAVADAARV